MFFLKDLSPIYSSVWINECCALKFSYACLGHNISNSYIWYLVTGTVYFVVLLFTPLL
jgi:hypothetical protein